MRTILSTICYGVVPAGLVSMGVFLPGVQPLALYGKVAVWTLGIILFVSPINSLYPNAPARFVLKYRRQFGVAVFWLAIFHGAGFIWRYEFFGLDSFSGWDNFLVYGAAGLIGMILLGVTSNDVSMRFLKRNWKRVHRISYLVLILVLFHVALATGTVENAFILSAIFIILKVLQWKRMTVQGIFKKSLQ